MARILVSQSYVLLRPLLEKILLDAGHQVHSVSTARETIVEACEGDYDLLLIDLDMALCGGLNTVRQIRHLKIAQDLKVLGLSNRRDREYVVEALKAGVSALLLKEHCTAEMLLERVEQLTGPMQAAPPSTRPPPQKTQKATPPHSQQQQQQAQKVAAPAPVQQLSVSAAPASTGPPMHPPVLADHKPLGQPPKPLTSAEIDAAIPKMLQGKALKPIVQKIIAMAENPNVDTASLAQVLRADMELSAKVIAAASSAFYRRRNITVRNLTDAINVIGINGTRNLATTLAVVDHFCANSSDPLLAMSGLWGHSISVAHLAELLAKESQLCDPDQAFIVGLLHDLGRIFMAEHFTEHYRHVVHTPPSTNELLHSLEQRIVGADHALIGGSVIERWGCPAFISRAVRLHHSQSIQSDEGEDPLGGMLRILLLAEAMAIALGYPADHLEELPMMPRGWLSKAIKAPAHFRETAIDSLRETQAMIMSRSDLSITPPEPWSGGYTQVLVLGTALHPLEPLQLLLSQAYPGAQFVPTARVDRTQSKTLVLADLRGISQVSDATWTVGWLARENAPENWPVLAIWPSAAEQIQQLGLGQHRAAVVAPPLRPALIRSAVESLAAEQRNPLELPTSNAAAA